MSASPPNRLSFLGELQRRNVHRAALFYAGAAWLLVQIATQVFPFFHIAEGVVRGIVVAAVIGFPFAMLFSWFYEWTPQGIKLESEIDRNQSVTRQTGRRLDRWIIGVLSVAVLLLLLNQFVLHRFMPAVGETPTVDTSDKSIAVLPFLNLSSDREQDYFSDGLAEEMLNQLTQLRQLRVIARTSSFSFKGKNVDAATIAKTLNVAALLEGSVRKSGATVRISAQLIRGADSSQLWSATYDRQLTDVLKVQDEIAGAVVAALKIELLSGQRIDNPRRTADAGAYDQYLLGKEFYSRANADGYRRAVAAYRRALMLDPGYAAAYAGLAYAEVYASDDAGTAAENAAAKTRALAAADQAIALAPDLADGYAARGWMRSNFAWNWAGAQRDFERALTLGAGSSEVQRRYGQLLGSQGRLPEAIAAIEKATQLDPLSSAVWGNLGYYLMTGGRLAEARRALQHALAINPGSSISRTNLAQTELLAGHAAEALTLFREADEGSRQFGVALAEHTLGHAAESRRALDELIAGFAQDYACQIAEVYAWRGERDAAFAWLERAYAQHDGGLSDIRLDPLLAMLRGDPRYALMLDKIGLSAAANPPNL